MQHEVIRLCERGGDPWKIEVPEGFVLIGAESEGGDLWVYAARLVASDEDDDE